MTESEGRALVRTASVLLLASLVRLGLAARQPPPLLPPDSANALPGLLEESRVRREEEARRRLPFGEGEALDPNVAPAVELDRLPGVGPGTAEAIVQARERGDRFDGPEDLLAVRGIGPATLEKMRAHLDFSSPTPLGPARRGGPGAAGVPLVPGARPAGAGEGGPQGPPGQPPDLPVELNSADLGELESLPGVGPALARRIVEERARRGRFGALEDLLAVRGIGPATLERLRPRVVVR
jgi:competence ComEA-like helix-hairpin-helix protein